MMCLTIVVVVMMCLTIVVVVIMCLSIVYSDGYDVSLVYNGRLCYDVAHCSVQGCIVLCVGHYSVQWWLLWCLTLVYIGVLCCKYCQTIGFYTVE
jgi:hypothetical protein